MPISKHLFTFDDFLLEKVDVTLFIITPELKEVLLSIDNTIARRIVANSVTNKEKKITLIDVVAGDYGKWSFVNTSKVTQFFDAENVSPSSNTILNIFRDKLQKYKSETRIGRVINKLYPDMYSAVEIENFVNEYKKYFQTKFELVDIVKGKDINKWYNCKNYEQQGEGTELNSSCMSPIERNDFMDFYAINDDRVSMVILYSDESKDKIDARALLWKPDVIDGVDNKDGKLFMDRIYYNNQEHKNLLQKYAENNKWYYKYTNSGVILADIYNPYGEHGKIKFELKNMKVADHRKFPYADTMAAFDTETNSISNDEYKYRKAGFLSSTIGGLDGVIWVDKYNKFIHATDLVSAIGVDGTESVLSGDTVLMPIYNNLYTKEYYDSHEKIKVKRPSDNGPGSKEYEVFKGNTEYCLMDDQEYYSNDVHYSEFLSEYIPKFNSRWVDNMDSFMPLSDLVEVTTSFDKSWGDYNPYKEWYHIDDPRYPYFKYKGEYYLNELEKDVPEYFEEKEKIEYANEES